MSGSVQGAAPVTKGVDALVPENERYRYSALGCCLDIYTWGSQINCRTIVAERSECII